MANEVIADADAQLTASLIGSMVEEARVGLVAPRFYRSTSIAGLPTMAEKISKHPATTDAASITDGTAMSNTGINPTAVTITAAGVGLKTIVTRFSAEGSLLGLQEAAANFGRALVNKMDVDGCSILDNFGTTVGTSGADLTIANILTAQYDLEVANEARNLVYVLHPIQVHDVRSAIVTSSAPVWSDGAAAAAAGFLGSTGAAGDPNYKGTLFGIPVYTSSNVPSVNADADRGGALFSVGRALRWVWKWMPTVETRSEPDYPGFMLAVTACYGFGEDVDGAGVSIITDHE